MAGLLVFERLATSGGVDEMLLLLDRGRSSSRVVPTGSWLSPTSAGAGSCSVYGSMLARLIETAPIAALIAEQRHHDARRVEKQVHALNRLVTDRLYRDDELEELRRLGQRSRSRPVACLVPFSRTWAAAASSRTS